MAPRPLNAQNLEGLRRLAASLCAASLLCSFPGPAVRSVAAALRGTPSGGRPVAPGSLALPVAAAYRSAVEIHLAGTLSLAPGAPALPLTPAKRALMERLLEPGPRADAAEPTVRSPAVEPANAALAPSRAEEEAPGPAPRAAARYSEGQKRRAAAVLAEIDRTLDELGPVESLGDAAALEAAIARLFDGLRREGLVEEPAAVEPALAQEGMPPGGALLPAQEAGAPAEARAEPPAPAAPRPPRDSREHWETHRARILSEAAALRAQLEAYAGLQERELGPARFRSAISRDRIAVESPLGRAELNTIDGERFIRVTHAETELALLFLDRGRIRADSKHLRQVVARQHMDAGRHRADGRLGRQAVLLWEEDGRAAGEEYRAKPRFLSRTWWAEYWHATWKRPERGDFWLALMMAALQGVLALGVGYLKVWLAGGAAVSFAALFGPVYFTMAYGFLIGLFASTYINWTLRGHPSSQYMKSAVVSVLFAYPVMLFVLGPAALNPLTLSGLIVHAHTLLNVAVNNLGKVAFQQLAKLGRANREWADEDSRPLPLGINRDSLYHQLLYMVNWFARLVELVIAPLGLAAVVSGKLIYLGYVAVARWLVLQYAERKGFPEAPAVRQRWDRDKAFLKRWVLGGWLLEKLKGAASGPARPR